MLEILRVVSFIIVGVLVLDDLLNGKLFLIFNIKRKPLTSKNYIGIGILIIFIIWPYIIEANLGNIGIKKLENRVSNAEQAIKDFFNRRVIEKILNKDLNLKSEKIGKFYNYEIPLKFEPVENTVELWLGENLQNPLYYDVKYSEKKLIFRNTDEPQAMKNYTENIGEPAITIQYIKK